MSSFVLTPLHVPPTPFPSRQQVVSLSQFSCVATVKLTGGEWGGGWTQIIRRQESLALYKSFNTLCFCPFLHVPLPCLAKRRMWGSRERGEGSPSSKGPKLSVYGSECLRLDMVVRNFLCYCV